MRWIAVAWMSGCLSYDVFSERVNEKHCEETLRCSTSGEVGNCDLYRVPGHTLCDFDGAAAHRCLSNDWECNVDQPGFEFAEPPLACDLVCRRPEE